VGKALVSAVGARALDTEASAEWGLDTFALVEAAGRACAQTLVRSLAAGERGGERPEFTVLAGSGNNAADALAMLRALILGGNAEPDLCSVFTNKPREENDIDKKTPLSQAVLALQKLGVSVKPWAAGKADFGSRSLSGRHRIVVDGISGTGLNGPLRGTALEMAEAVNALRPETGGGNAAGFTVVSIDIPSGGFDDWRSGMPIVTAHFTLAIEPRKLCLYTPAVRPHSGTILSVGGIFPPALIDKYGDAELLEWEDASVRIRPVPPTAHKYERGVVEIRAGSPGAAGAARLAALGSQAAGAGIVRLLVDASLYAAVAGSCSGVMVVASTDVAGGNTRSGVAVSGSGAAPEAPRFSPAAVLLGPGWGRGEDRIRLLESYLPLEKHGPDGTKCVPLILDADAIALAKDTGFHGNAILTPHVGEFAFCTGLSKEEIFADTVHVLRSFAAKKNATVLLKSHVMYVAAPDGRIGIIDGMNPVLAAGGSGDVLAGFCAAIAARSALEADGAENRFDGYACACAAATLLVRAAKSKGVANSFVDSAELARAAAAVAGSAWVLHE